MYGVCRHQRNHTLKQRLCKACVLLLAPLCAKLTGLFAYAHARHDHRANWAELTKSTSTWVVNNQRLPDPTPIVFFIACMAFAALAYLYHRSNDSDVYQKPVLVSGAMAGLLVALSSDVGVLLGVFALEPWFLLLGLVVSDCFHSVFVQRTWDAMCKKKAFDDGKA